MMDFPCTLFTTTLLTSKAEKVIIVPEIQVFQLEESQQARKRNVPDKLNTVDPIRFVALL